MDTDDANWRDGATDDLIAAQRAEIDAAIADAQPLLGDEEDPAVLVDAYADNAALLPKVRSFAAAHVAVRRARGDGSCFYRCFLFGLGRYFVGAGVRARGADAALAAAPGSAQAAYDGLVAHVAGSLAALLALGYPDVTMPDFHDAFTDFVVGLGAPGATVDSAVVAPLRDRYVALYLITYLRCLTSLELLTHADEYEPFVLGLAPHCATVKQFCDSEVEAVNNDADQLQVIALSKALRVRVVIACAFGGAGHSGTPCGAGRRAFECSLRSQGASGLRRHRDWVSIPQAAIVSIHHEI